MSGSFIEKNLFFFDDNNNKELKQPISLPDSASLKQNVNDIDLSFIMTVFYFLTTYWDKEKIPNPVLLLHPPDLKSKTVLNVISNFFPEIQIIVYTGSPRGTRYSNKILHFHGNTVINITEEMTLESIGDLYSEKLNIIFIYYYRSNDNLTDSLIGNLDKYQLSLFHKIKPVLSMLSFYYTNEPTPVKYYPKGILLKKPFNNDSIANCMLIPFSKLVPENGIQLKNPENYYKVCKNYQMKEFLHYYHWFSKIERRKNFLNPWSKNYQPIYNLELTNDFDSLYVVITILLLLKKINHPNCKSYKTFMKTYKLITDQIKNIKEETGVVLYLTPLRMYS
jgi:hypothetical protein